MLISSLIILLMRIVFVISGNNVLPKKGTDPYTQLLFSTIGEVHLASTANPSLSTMLAKSHGNNVLIDYLFKDSLIFFTEPTTEDNNIYYLKMLNTSSNVTTNLLGNQGTYVRSFAVDWIGRKVYWSNDEENVIEVLDLVSGWRKVLFWKDLTLVQCIAVDSKHGYLYWSHRRRPLTIERSGLDGSRRSTFYSDKTTEGAGLSLDLAGERVYWFDVKAHAITSVDFLGGNKRRIQLKFKLHNSLLEMSVLHGWVYLVENLRGIRRVNETGDSQLIVKTKNSIVRDVRVFHADKQPEGRTTSPSCQVDNGGCSHLCLPSPTAYTCACPTGVRLLANGRSCEKGPRRFLLLTSHKGVSRLSLDTPDRVPVLLVRSDPNHLPCKIDYDPVERKIYWINDQMTIISKADLDGKNAHIVIVSPGQTNGLAVDWIARNLYWVTPTPSYQLWVSRLDGSSPRLLQSLDPVKTVQAGMVEPVPWTLAVDPVNRALFLSYSKEKIVPGRLETMWLDGSHRQTVVELTDSWLNGIALDPTQKLVYLADGNQRTIFRVAYSGANITRLISEVPHSYGLALMDGSLYWTVWGQYSGLSALLHANLSESSSRQYLYRTKWLNGIKAVNLDEAVAVVKNPCAQKNGGCSHICLAMPANTSWEHYCACPADMEMRADNRTCFPPKGILIYSTRTAIIRHPLNLTLDANSSKTEAPVASKDRMSVSNVLSLRGLAHARKIDLNILEGRIYWSDGRSIHRAFLNGSQQEVLLTLDGGTVEDLALDWMSNNLYFSQVGRWHRIEVISLGTVESGEQAWDMRRRIVVSGRLTSPAALAVHPGQRRLYWLDSLKNSRHKLESSALNGSQRTVLVNIQNGIPFSLTIDYTDGAGRLYWYHSNGISSCLLDGSQLVTVTPILSGHFSPHALEIFQGVLYFTDWETNATFRILKDDILSSKTTKIQPTKVFACPAPPMDLFVIHKNRQPLIFNNEKNSLGDSTHPCATPLVRSQLKKTLGGVDLGEVARCNHICFESAVSSSGYSRDGHGYTCACPTHFSLDKDSGLCNPPSNYLVLVLESGVLRRFTPNEVPLDLDYHHSPHTVHKKVKVGVAVWDPRQGGTLFYTSADDEGAVHYVRVETATQGKVQARWHDQKPLSNLLQPSSSKPTQKKPTQVAYDVLNQVLFWTDPGQGVIGASSMATGNFLGFVVNRTKPGDHIPLSIAVDPLTGRLFWTSAVRDDESKKQCDTTDQKNHYLSEDNTWWCNFQIEMAFLDGSEQRRLLEAGRTYRPQGLYCDLPTGHMYWVDTRKSKGKVEKFEVNTLEKDITVGTKQGDLGSHIVFADAVKIDSLRGLATLGKVVYWFDGQLKRARPDGPRAVEAVLQLGMRENGEGQEQLVTMFPVTPLLTSIVKWHPCSRSRGGCSHFCIPVRRGSWDPPDRDDLNPSYRCGCPVGMELEMRDQPRNCHTVAPCEKPNFHCVAGVRLGQDKKSISRSCIRADWRCDGVGDCLDNADEKNCKCTDMEFKCKSGPKRCITHLQQCNGVTDCDDGSDEINCFHPIMHNPWHGAGLLESSQSRTTYTVAIVMAVLAVVVTFGVAGYTCTKRRHRDPLLSSYMMSADRVDIMLVPRHGSYPTHSTDGHKLETVCSSHPSCSAVGKPASTHISTRSTCHRQSSRLGGSRRGPSTLLGSNQTYDRARLTGTSSVSEVGSGTMDGYPQEPLNPPPSPITEVSLELPPPSAGSGRPLDFTTWWHSGPLSGDSLLSLFKGKSSPTTDRATHQPSEETPQKTGKWRRKRNGGRHPRRYRNVRLVIYAETPPPSDASPPWCPSDEECLESPPPLPPPPPSLLAPPPSTASAARRHASTSTSSGASRRRHHHRRPRRYQRTMPPPPTPENYSDC